MAMKRRLIASLGAYVVGWIVGCTLSGQPVLFNWQIAVGIAVSLTILVLVIHWLARKHNA